MNVDLEEIRRARDEADAHKNEAWSVTVDGGDQRPVAPAGFPGPYPPSYTATSTGYSVTEASHTETVYQDSGSVTAEEVTRASSQAVAQILSLRIAADLDRPAAIRAAGDQFCAD